MSTLEAIKKQLNECKGSDRWSLIAAHANCHYFTVARIARGAIKSPSVDICDRIAAAIKATAPRRQRASEPAKVA